MKQDFWLELESVMNSGQHAWVCIGDFNDLVDKNEKFGGLDDTCNPIFS